MSRPQPIKIMKKQLVKNSHNIEIKYNLFPNEISESSRKNQIAQENEHKYIGTLLDDYKFIMK